MPSQCLVIFAMPENSNDNNRTDTDGVLRRDYLAAAGLAGLGLAGGTASGKRSAGRTSDHLRFDTVETNQLTGNLTDGADLTSIAGEGLDIDESGQLNVSTMAATGPSSSTVTYWDIDDQSETDDDAALEAILGDADFKEGDWIVMSNGSYKFTDNHTINKSCTIYARGSTIRSNAGNVNDIYSVIRFKGERGSSTTLSTAANEHDDVVNVDSTTGFVKGDDVIVNNAGETWGNRTYRPTRSRIREVKNGNLYLESPLKYDYVSGDEVTSINPVVGARIIGGTWTELNGTPPGILFSLSDTRNCIVKDVHVETYERHAFQTIDSWQTRFVDCSTGPPASFGSSSGETYRIGGSSDVFIDRPVINRCRRGIDIRSGCKTVHVTDPLITGVELVGISYHHDETNSEYVRGSFDIRGGLIAASEDSGSWCVATTPKSGQMRMQNTHLVTRNNSEIYGTDVIWEGVTLHECDSSSDDTLLFRQLSNAQAPQNVRLKDLTITNDAAQKRAIRVKDGSDIGVTGRIEGDYGEPSEDSSGNVTQHSVVRVDGAASRVDLDLNIRDTNNRSNEEAAVDIRGSDVSLRGRINGYYDDVVTVRSGANNVDISVDIDDEGSGDTGHHAFKLYECSNVNVHDCNVSVGGRGVLFVGSNVTATDVAIRNNWFDVGNSVAVGDWPNTAETLTNVWIAGNNLSVGSSSNVEFDSPVDGLFITENVCNAIQEGSSTNVQKHANLTGR